MSVAPIPLSSLGYSSVSAWVTLAISARACIDTDAGFQPTESMEGESCASIEQAIVDPLANRHVNICGAEALSEQIERGGHNADDGVVAVVKSERTLR